MSIADLQPSCALRRVAALLLLLGASAAHGTDTFGPAPYELQIPLLGIGTATYSNVVLTVNLPTLSGPSGYEPLGSEDIYDPANNRLSVPALGIGAVTYYNAVVTVDQLTSIGAVTGADTFDGTNLVVPEVQVLGGQSYHNLTLHVGSANIVRVGGGLPTVATDQYDEATGLLTVGAVQYGARVYTNVVLKVGTGNITALAGYTASVLYSFQNGADGAAPTGALMIDSSGNLFGTTSGGETGDGTVFALVPNSGGAGYTENVLYSFKGGSDGSTPAAGLITDGSGNFLGTTIFGGGGTNQGAYGDGTVFQISPCIRIVLHGNCPTESVVYAFQGGADGSEPRGGLVRDISGNLYGTTYYGGSSNRGTIYMLVPNGSGGYGESVLYSFQGSSDGAFPMGALALDGEGNLYGTTSGGGGAGCGTVFKFTRSVTGSFSFGVLYTFQGGSDGCQPQAGVTLDTAGNLYGSSSGYGSAGYGSVFELSPAAGGAYAFTLLYGFQGGTDGAYPAAGVLLDAAGNVYGTSFGGGSGGNGNVFMVTPSAAEFFEPTLRVLYEFQGGSDASQPQAALIQDPAGNLYGTATAGAGAGVGGVFRIH